MPIISIIDDDPIFLDSLSYGLSDEWEVQKWSALEDFLDEIEDFTDDEIPQVVLVDRFIAPEDIDCLEKKVGVLLRDTYGIKACLMLYSCLQVSDQDFKDAGFDVFIEKTDHIASAVQKQLDLLN